MVSQVPEEDGKKVSFRHKALDRSPYKKYLSNVGMICHILCESSLGCKGLQIYPFSRRRFCPM